jgi:hypothetical protein
MREVAKLMHQWKKASNRIGSQGRKSNLPKKSPLLLIPVPQTTLPNHLDCCTNYSYHFQTLQRMTYSLCSFIQLKEENGCVPTMPQAQG